MDRFLITGAVLLLFLEVGVLLTNLDSSGLNAFAWHGSQKQIGTLTSKQNAVQKRGAHTLIWDEVHSNETLYEYDSVLTLSESSASLNLGDTKLELDQDTLVVLEPSSAVAGGFRIRFSKGSSRTRNPSQPLNIVTESFEMTAAPGSSLLFSTLDDGRLHLDVEKGHVDLHGSQGPSSFESGETLLLKNGIVEEKKKLTDDFKWSSGLPKRIYSQRFPAKQKVSWVGDPSSIKILEPRKAVASVAANEKHEAEIELGEGKSFLWLEDGDKVSRKVDIETRSVPLIHIFNPRMRDRVRTGDPVVFAWSASEELNKYRIEISRQRDFRTVETSLETELPRIDHQFAKAGTYYWRITPVDELGIALPPTSPGEFSVVPVDLEAPLLNPTEIREPADETPTSGAMLWLDLFISRAWAKESDAVAVFSWKPVAEAQYYQIEISTTPDFSVVVHTEKLTATKFEWRAAREKKYFWRVAAGRDDELGPFSEVDTVAVKAVVKPKVIAKSVTETSEAHSEAPSDEVPKPTAVAIAVPVAVAPTPTPTPKPAPVPAPSAAPPEKEIPFADRTHRKNGRFGVAPNERISKTTNALETVGSFTGLVPISLQAEFYFAFSNQSRVELAAAFEQVQWKPKDTSMPQQNLSETDSSLSIAYRPSNSSWSFGAGTESVALLKRKASEEAELEMSTLFGPTVRFTHELGKGVIDFGIDARFGQLTGGRATTSWVMPLFGERFTCGPQASYDTFSGSGESQQKLKLGIYFGIGW